MEGLEISVVKLSEVLEDVDLRLESEYYNSEHIVFNSVQGCDIESFSQYGTSEDLNEEGKGFPILRLNEFDSFFISKPSKYCDLISKETFELLKLKKNDVLICRTNGNPKYVGKAAIVPKNYEYAFASYVFRLRPKTDIINSATLVSFLNSKYGRIEIEKYSMVGNQANFSPAKFRQIAIPILSKELNNKIEEIVYKSFELLEESKSLYSQAEDLLLGELGLKDWRPKNTLHTTKKFSDFAQSGRLDAEYYQPKYDEIEKAIKSYKGGYDIVSNLFNQNLDVCDYKKTEYNYIEIGDVNVGDGSVSFNKVETSELPDNAKRVLNKNDILISKVRPYRGAVAIIDFEQEDLIGSGAFTVLQEKSSYKKETLQILFRTAVYKDWLLKWNVGSSYPVIKDEDILNLPIPILPEQIQTKIASLIQQSFECKAQSKQLLEDAKRMVEAEIEKN
ncbi:MAG: restriction endonuclease subunit S [Lachnospiraceae bacterium]|nr:restriction endonuclease subunit S [Lachnospiraceae bacterium]